MNNKSRSGVAHLLAVSIVLFASLFPFAGQARAQTRSSKQEANLEDALYRCLWNKFPNVHRQESDHTRAFDPQSGRNFAWASDKQAWIDTKTLESVCPVSAPGQAASTAQLEDALYRCLWNKFPDVHRQESDHTRAFDPQSGRNFAWDSDKQAWIDVKTLECICPKCDAGQVKEVIEKKKEACDIEFGYDYMRAPDESAKNLNGFGGSLFCNVKPWIAIGGDFGALFGSTTDTVGTTKIDVSLHRQTYLFGPQFNFYPNDKVKVFVHPLFGGVHDSTKTTIGTTTTDFSANAFAMAFGGGVDVNLNNHFAIRPIQVDYLPTRFGGAWQSNYRISTGLVIRFGGKK